MELPPPSSPLFPYTTLFRSIFERGRKDAWGSDFRYANAISSGDRGTGTTIMVARNLFFDRSEEHTSELQSRLHLVCRLLLEKKKSTRSTAACRALPSP